MKMGQSWLGMKEFPIVKKSACRTWRVHTAAFKASLACSPARRPDPGRTAQTARAAHDADGLSATMSGSDRGRGPSHLFGWHLTLYCANESAHHVGDRQQPSAPVRVFEELQHARRGFDDTGEFVAARIDAACLVVNGCGLLRHSCNLHSVEVGPAQDSAAQKSDRCHVDHRAVDLDGPRAGCFGGRVLGD